MRTSKDSIGTKNATLRDIAQHAGVSVATVSRSISGRQRFSPAVHARIEQAIQALGYRMHSAARSMSTGRSFTLAALVGNIQRANVVAAIRGINREALAAGYGVVLIDASQPSTTLTELERVLSMQVDGLVLAVDLPDEAHELLLQYGRPMSDLGPDAAAQSTLEFDAGQLLGHYLARCACRSVAYLSCADEPGDTSQWMGLKQALETAAVAVERVATPSAQAEAAFTSTTQRLLQAPAPDALVGCNDEVAMGAVSAVHQLHSAAAAPIAVAGFGNALLSSHWNPSLTSVDLHHEQRGARAVRRLVAEIEEAPQAPESPLMPTLEIRESTSMRQR
jgi:DNA-binding LacI/PurR family transcriptional regulator